MVLPVSTLRGNNYEAHAQADSDAHLVLLTHLRRQLHRRQGAVVEAATEEAAVIYAQFRAGQKLHLVYEPGEGYGDQIIRKGELSWPLCGRREDRPYRMTINMPLGRACHNCQRVYRTRP